MLRLENVGRTVGDFAISDITFTAAPNDYVVILGPTGCGKTVLLETIAGIGRPDSGRIYIDGRDVTQTSPEKRNIGFVYQRSMLFPHYTVLKNIAYGMRLRKLSSKEQRERIDNLVDMLKIEHLLDREVRNLSGGESQKVALARALAIEPPILLLDEPLAPLDPPSKEDLRAQIISMHERLNPTIVHVTHDQLTARILADKIGVIRDGALCQFGRADEVFEKPNSEFVARFVGIENVFHGFAAEGEVSLQPESDSVMILKADTPLRGQVGVCISPDVIHAYASNGSFANKFTGTVRSVLDRGAVFRAEVDVAGQAFTVDVSRREYEQRPVVPGSDIAIGFPADKVHCFEL